MPVNGLVNQTAFEGRLDTTGVQSSLNIYIASS